MNASTENEPRRRNSLADVKRVSAELIAAKGYQDTALSDIAEALGVRKATIYHHVKSKEQLLFWIIKDYMDLGTEILATAKHGAASSVDLLRALILEHLRAMAAHPVEATVVARELSTLDGDYRVEAMRRRRQA